MDKIYVVYWSQSGNTQAMAEAIGRGIEVVVQELWAVNQKLNERGVYVY